MNRSGKKNGFVLEVIACSVQDAVEAEKGGADRLEIIRDFEGGGYTPSLELVRQFRSSVSLPLRVMLREEAGYGLTEIIAVEKLCCVANELNKMKIDGVVLGFVHANRVDMAMTKKVLSCASDLKATFHHAFENTGNKHAAIDELKQLEQIDKILSHGGRGLCKERVENLAEYAAAADPKIQILAGGRIDRHMIEAIRQDTGIQEFHIGTAARENGRVCASRVEMLAKAVKGIYV